MHYECTYARPSGQQHETKVMPVEGKDFWKSQVMEFIKNSITLIFGMLHQTQKPLGQPGGFCQYLILNCFCILPPGIWAPLAYAPPPTLKDISNTQNKFQKREGISNTIKSYGWYSGLCLVATVRQLWNS